MTKFGLLSIFMAMMESHLEGFKQGSDLTDLIYMIERSLRLPHGGRLAEEQEWRKGASCCRYPGIQFGLLAWDGTTGRGKEGEWTLN